LRQQWEKHNTPLTSERAKQGIATDNEHFPSAYPKSHEAEQRRAHRDNATNHKQFIERDGDLKRFEKNNAKELKAEDYKMKWADRTGAKNIAEIKQHVKAARDDFDKNSLKTRLNARHDNIKIRNEFKQELKAFKDEARHERLQKYKGQEHTTTLRQKQKDYDDTPNRGSGVHRRNAIMESMAQYRKDHRDDLKEEVKYRQANGDSKGMEKFSGQVKSFFRSFRN
jgi:hypothetical protein